MWKQVLIPVAAFAVTATSVAAFSGGVDWSSLGVDLSDSQVSALEEAQTIRQNADEQARQVLEDAGIDQDTMRQIHDAMHEHMQANHEAVDAALESGDYNAFLAAVADTPLADTIDTEAKFEQFAEAHQLRKDGDLEGARAIMDELGIQGPKGDMGMGDHRGFGEGRPDDDQ